MLYKFTKFLSNPYFDDNKQEGECFERSSAAQKERRSAVYTTPQVIASYLLSVRPAANGFLMGTLGKQKSSQ